VYGSPNLPDTKECEQSTCTFFTQIFADFWHFGGKIVSKQI